MTMPQIRIVLLTLQLFCCAHSSLEAQTLTPANYDSLRRELEGMFDADQEIRRILVDSIGINSPEDGKYMNQMAVIDSRNKIKITSILEKYGWIGKSKIGEKASDGIFYIVQHTDLEFLEKYFPQFKKQTDKGEASAKLCGMMEDRLLMWKGKKQIYGSQASNALRSDKKMAIWPIENPSRVNELRKKAGFTSTVEENAKRLNAEYDPNEKLPLTGKKSD